MAMWRCTFSMTTMASSTTSPVASVMPKSVSELMEKPKSLMKAKVPISETGMVTAGMMVARQSSRKRKMTAMTMTMASAERDQHFADGVADHGGGVEGDGVFQARRKALGELRERGLGLAVHIKGVGVGELHDADAHGIMAGVFERRSCNLRRPPRSGPHP